jgi:hypothetical protein
VNCALLKYLGDDPSKLLNHYHPLVEQLEKDILVSRAPLAIRDHRHHRCDDGRAEGLQILDAQRELSHGDCGRSALALSLLQPFNLSTEFLAQPIPFLRGQPIRHVVEDMLPASELPGLPRHLLGRA